MTNSEFIKTKQEILLEGIIELKKILDKNNIKFYLRGGSVMGAVKYNGFVPWDDDMDIAVPRKDYDKLIDILNGKVFSEKFEVISSKYNATAHCYFPRLFLIEKVRKELDLEKNTNLGLHLIDILPIDGAPNNKFNRNIYFGKVYILRFLASLGTFYGEGEVDMHSPKQKVIIKMAKLMQLHKIFPQQKVYKILDRLYTKYDWKKQDYAGTITASLFKKEVMPVEIWGEGVWHQFETEKFLIPTDYDRYLKIMYGENYLSEEPDEKKSHHK